MDLVYAVALFSVATVLSVVVLLSSRMPVEPVWATEGLVANVWCVLITGLIAFGACFGVRFFVNISEQFLGFRELGLVVAILAACYMILRQLAPRRRLADYAARLSQSGGNVIGASNLDSVAMVSPGANGRSQDKADLPKAA